MDSQSKIVGDVLGQTVDMGANEAQCQACTLQSGKGTLITNLSLSLSPSLPEDIYVYIYIDIYCINICV